MALFKTRSAAVYGIDAHLIVEQHCGRRLAAFGEHRLITGTRDDGLEDAPLHRIVVDDENTLGHAELDWVYRIGALSPRRFK